MKGVPILAAGLAAIAGCASGEQKQGPTAAWLAAVWEQDAAACGAGTGSLRFQRDGTYSIGDELGRWQLSGNTLFILQTGQVDAGGKSSPFSGQPVELRVGRLAGHRMEVDWPSGERYLYYRCG